MRVDGWLTNPRILGGQNHLVMDEYETHLFLSSVLMNIRDLKVQFNAKLWNLHPDLCFAVK